MELTTIQDNTGALTRQFVRQGIAGNYDVVYAMIRVIRDSVSYDREIEKLAKGILVEARLDSHSRPLDQLTAIYEWVQLHVKYIQDQAGLIESIKSARVTIEDQYGDCDDLTNTIATLVGCLGFEDVRLAMARYAVNDPGFVHIYPVVYVKDKRYILDATLPNGVINQEVKPLEVREIPVFGDVPGLDGLSGFFNNIKYYSRKFAGATIEAIPAAAEHLPLGFMAGKAFATGAQLLTQTQNQTLSINATVSKINRKLNEIITELVNSTMAIEVAKSYAVQVAAQLSTLQVDRKSEDYKIMTASVQRRLDFINNFESYAQARGIKVIHLNPQLILLTGITGVSIGAYAFYKRYKGKRLF